MIRQSQLIGQRVLSRSSGQFVGSVRRLLVDAHRGAVTTAQLEAPVGGAVLLDWSKVVAVSRAALMVDDEATRAPADERDQRFVNGHLEVVGKTVLTDEGDSLGELEDFELDEASGRVVRLLLAGQALTAGRFVAVGPDALIIAATSATSTAASAR